LLLGFEREEGDAFSFWWCCCCYWFEWEGGNNYLGFNLIFLGLFEAFDDDMNMIDENEKEEDEEDGES